ncbi:hypothetical protein ACWGB8_29105 [Kitasatospora sp. NPDC054939]
MPTREHPPTAPDDRPEPHDREPVPIGDVLPAALATLHALARAAAPRPAAPAPRRAAHPPAA